MSLVMGQRHAGESWVGILLCNNTTQDEMNTTRAQPTRPPERPKGGKEGEGQVGLQLIIKEEGRSNRIAAGQGFWL